MEVTEATVDDGAGAAAGVAVRIGAGLLAAFAGADVAAGCGERGAGAGGGVWTATGGGLLTGCDGAGWGATLTVVTSLPCTPACPGAGRVRAVVPALRFGSGSSAAAGGLP